MAMCIICRVNKAEVPDRETMSPRLRVCVRCHGLRLRGDMVKILELQRSKNQPKETKESEGAMNPK